MANRLGEWERQISALQNVNFDSDDIDAYAHLLLTTAVFFLFLQCF